MKYLFDHWKIIKNELDKKIVFLFLDYDGTLAPIAETPDKAAIPKETRELLKEISGDPRLRLAIISGRSLSDIKRAIGLKNVSYAGNHGLEIESPKLKFKSQVSPRLKEVIRNIYEELLLKVSKIKGAILEDKGLTVSLHYRLVADRDMPGLKCIMRKATEPFLARDEIKVSEGKKVFEIKPQVKWTKGNVVLWLLARQQLALGADKLFPVYIGDDVTDEDGFRALKNKGLTIFVGKPKPSEAAYYVKNTKEVVKFMKQLLELG
jgi:trehalose-phosphatase